MHLYAPTPGGWAAVPGRLSSRSSHLTRRAPSSRTVISAAVVASIVVVLSIAYFVISWRKRGRKQKGQDVQELKPGFFGRLLGQIRLKRDKYQQTSGDDTADRRQSHQLNTTRSQQGRDVEQAQNTSNSTAATAVDRHASVRSVMTLPPYRQMAGTNEQVLGREGERDGVDTILDLPTEEAEEELRDEEMAALYQIRLTRRQQIAEREERRVARREARERNDAAALRELRARTTAANNDTSLVTLRAEVDRIKESRQRSVSSVSYADVGIARHDGTRIRANSSESERIGLLSDAASMASHNDAASGHHRGRSASSAISIDSDFPSPALTRSRGDSQTTLTRLGSREDRAGSSPELIEADLGDETMPPPEYVDVSLEEERSTTPQFEPPPEYSGPYRSGSQRTQRSEYDLGMTSRAGLEFGGSRDQSQQSTPTSARGVGGIPQLPSLRISGLPQIVIEPSSARPGEEQHRQL